MDIREPGIALEDDAFRLETGEVLGQGIGTREEGGFLGKADGRCIVDA
jgi:hypothetical protein